MSLKFLRCPQGYFVFPLIWMYHSKTQSNDRFLRSEILFSTFTFIYLSFPSLEALYWHCWTINTSHVYSLPAYVGVVALSFLPLPVYLFLGTLTLFIDDAFIVAHLTTEPLIRVDCTFRSSPQLFLPSILVIYGNVLYLYN